MRVRLGPARARRAPRPARTGRAESAAPLGWRSLRASGRPARAAALMFRNFRSGRGDGGMRRPARASPARAPPAPSSLGVSRGGRLARLGVAACSLLPRARIARRAPPCPPAWNRPGFAGIRPGIATYCAPPFSRALCLRATTAARSGSRARVRTSIRRRDGAPRPPASGILVRPHSCRSLSRCGSLSECGVCRSGGASHSSSALRSVHHGRNACTHAARRALRASASVLGSNEGSNRHGRGWRVTEASVGAWVPRPLRPMHVSNFSPADVSYLPYVSGFPYPANPENTSCMPYTRA